MQEPTIEAIITTNNETLQYQQVALVWSTISNPADCRYPVAEIHKRCLETIAQMGLDIQISIDQIIKKSLKQFTHFHA